MIEKKEERLPIPGPEPFRRPRKQRKPIDFSEYEKVDEDARDHKEEEGQ